MSETADLIDAGRGLCSASQAAANAAPARSTAGKPRLGFAGVGWIGRNRLDAIAAADTAEIVAVAEPFAEARAEVKTRFPSIEVATDYNELLRLNLDGVVIATPSALHSAQAIAALESGLAVFCQKPLARTAAETASVIAAARANDRLLGVDLSYRGTAGMRAIRELIQGGELGRIYAIEAVFHNAYGPDKAWFYDLNAAGGGCLLDLGIHLVDLALWSLGFPRVESVRGVLCCRERADFRPGTQVEDYAAGQIVLAGGTALQLACSWRVPAGCDARIELTFFGTKGGASFRNVNGSFYDFVAEHLLPDRTRRVLAVPPDAWGGRAAVGWAQRLAASRAFDPEIENLTAVAATLDALYGR
jgi:predicted dehydrogenase